MNCTEWPVTREEVIGLEAASLSTVLLMVFLILLQAVAIFIKSVSAQK